MVFLKQYLTSKCDFIVKYFYPASHSELLTDKCMTEIKSDQKKLNESNALILKSLMEIRQSYADLREPQKNTRKTTKKLI